MSGAAHPCATQDLLRRPEGWAGAHGDTITLQESLALANNPRLQSVSWEERFQEARALQAGLWPNPVLGTETEDLLTNEPIGDFVDASAGLPLHNIIDATTLGRSQRGFLRKPAIGGAPGNPLRGALTPGPTGGVWTPPIDVTLLFAYPPL